MRLLRAVSVGGRRVVLAAGLACLLGGGLAGPAEAEVGAGASPTSQAIAANAQFLEYAPPPPQPGVVCLVDSGVDPNPDTTAALVGAEGANPSWGSADGLAATQPLVEGHPNGHGTEMAMIMAAPQNGWGMVGIAPTAVRVYSVRVVPPGGTTFGLPSYSYAMARCEVLRGTTVPGLTVVNLSLGGAATPTTDEVTFIRESVDEARFHGLNIVAAAGNDGSVLFPASYPPVVAVGAGDARVPSAGGLCSFSTATLLDLIAPGCDTAVGGIDEVFEDDGTPALAFGTSEAAALTSGVLAAMRAYGPTLSTDDAEHCLTSTAINGRNLDVEGAFTACGLARIVREGLAAMPPAATAPTGPVTVDPPASAIPSRPQPVSRRIAMPRIVRADLRRGRLVVTVLNRPRAASVEVKALGRRYRVSAVRTARSRRISLRATNAYYVIVRFVVPGSKVRSAWALRRIR